MTRGSQYKEKKRQNSENPFHNFFSPLSRGSSSPAPPKMATPHEYNMRRGKVPYSMENDPVTIPTTSADTGNGTTRTSFTQDTMPSVHHQLPEGIMVSSLPPDLQKLLQCIPSKADFEALALKLDTKYEERLTSLQQDTVSLSVQVKTQQEETSSLIKKMSDLEAHQIASELKMRTLQLQLEDAEDRNRRNNVRIKGIPENVPPYLLREAVLSIFHQLLGEDCADKMDLDRVHRAFGQRSFDSSRPRDVLCRIHFFTTKDIIINRAWKKKTVDFEGVKLKILPDLSRNTLRRRAILKPLLSNVLGAGATYKWGFPLHLIVKKDNVSYPIFTMTDVQPVLQELGIPPFHQDDWLGDLPEDPPRPPRPRPGPQNGNRGRGPRSPHRSSQNTSSDA